MFGRLASGGLERRGEILGGGLDGLRHGHDEPTVAVEDLTCVDDGLARGSSLAIQGRLPHGPDKERRLGSNSCGR